MALADRTGRAGRAWAVCERPGWRLGLGCGIVSLVFWRPLQRVFDLAWGDEASSHILLIPLVVVYLLWLRWGRLGKVRGDWALAVVFLLAGLLVPVVGRWGNAAGLGAGSGLGLMMVAYVMTLIAVGFAVLGRAGMKLMAFPFGMLGFMVPVPVAWLAWMERGMMEASTVVAGWLMELGGMSVLRRGEWLELPVIVLRVAPECSGIRSTIVLLISGLLAGHLFLGRAAFRWVLVGVVWPLGVLRNGLRVAVIGGMCSRWGPEMIESPVHRHGGPLFFALSMVPMVLLVVWLRRLEQRGVGGVRRTTGE